MNHVIYNAHILRYEGKLLSPIRLRYDLLKWTPASTVQKLSKRNRALRVVFHPIEISEEHEEVYALYRQFRFGIDPYNLKMSILFLLLLITRHLMSTVFPFSFTSRL